MNTTKLTTSKKDVFMRYGLIALALTAFFAFAMFGGMPTALAVSTKIGNVMTTIIGLVADAAKYVGIIIVIWGVFQIVMAFRREDSEAIGKQITSVVVGAILVGFGATANKLYNALK